MNIAITTTTDPKDNGVVYFTSCDTVAEHQRDYLCEDDDEQTITVLSFPKDLESEKGEDFEDAVEAFDSLRSVNIEEFGSFGRTLEAMLTATFNAGVKFGREGIEGFRQKVSKAEKPSLPDPNLQYLPKWARPAE
jgi:hypothetical protein